MNIGRSFLMALALGTGLAAPFFVFAGGDSAEVTAETRERVERALEQMRSDSPIVRQSGEASLANETQGSLELLRESAAKAKANGEIDLERRINDAISKIELRDGLKPKAPEAKPNSNDRVQGQSNRITLDLSGQGGASIKTSTWIENGKVTTVAQAGDGKITLTIREPGQNEVVETFETQADFEAKHPEIAKRFAGMNQTFQFRGPWGPRQAPEAPAPRELDLEDPFKQMNDMLERFGLGRGGVVPRQGATPSLDEVTKKLDTLKTKQAELETLLHDPVQLRLKLDEVKAETQKLEDEINKLKAIPRVPRFPGEGLEDPMQRMRKLMEEMWGAPGEPRGEGNPNDPFERIRKMMEDMQRGRGEPDEGGSPGWRLPELPEFPEGGGGLDELRKLFERNNRGEPEEGIKPGAEKEPWKGSDDKSGSGTPDNKSGEEKPLPEKPKGVGDDQ